jgi:hypothetical protein
MQPIPEIHSHPDNQNDRVHGYLLESGDTLEAGDVYSSSNGRWDFCSCPGLVLQCSRSEPPQDDESVLPPKLAPSPIIWVRPIPMGPYMPKTVLGAGLVYTPYKIR